MDFNEDKEDRGEAYRILAELYSEPPDQEFLETIKEDFQLEFTGTEEDVRKEFDHLFLYPEGKLPPIESLFVSGAEKSPAESTAQFYTEAGLSIEEEFEVMPDHISLEFLFMSYLIGNNNIEMQIKFLEEHIMNWVPHFCEEVIKEAKTVFYREIAEITKDFIESEYESYE